MRDNRSDPTPYAVICKDGCGTVFLSEQDYRKQLGDAYIPWRCTKCGGRAEWDDDCLETSPQAGR